jgi:hypothetical protein
LDTNREACAKGEVENAGTGALFPAAQPQDRRGAPILEGDELARAILLARHDPEQLYAKFTAGDPLRLFERSARRLRDRYYMLETQRVADRAAVLAAHIPFERDDELEPWLLERIDEAIDDVLVQDAERLRQGAPYVVEDYEVLLQFVNLGPDRALEGSAAFNGLSDLARKTFFDLLVYHRSIASCLEIGLGPLELLKHRAQ